MNNDVEKLYEDESILAVIKPAGMIVNKADTAKDMYTLQDYSEKKLDISSLKNTPYKKDGYIVDGYNKFDEFISRGGIVHRLDKETSGIILIAKTPSAFMALQEQFKNKTIQKKYITLVHGLLEKESGKIDAPIGRLPWNRMRFGVLDEGRHAVTSYRVLSKKIDKDKKANKSYSLVNVFPETGRTHQIRVHFQFIGHPIFADSLYAGRKQARDDRKILLRHFLHASEISFAHPVTGKLIELSSELPEDLKQVVDNLDNLA